MFPVHPLPSVSSAPLVSASVSIEPYEPESPAAKPTTHLPPSSSPEPTIILPTQQPQSSERAVRPAEQPESFNFPESQQPQWVEEMSPLTHSCLVAATGTVAPLNCLVGNPQPLGPILWAGRPPEPCGHSSRFSVGPLDCFCPAL